ncbi:hypothetical protein IEO21_03885 [Rhodonia placenta]|uniref:Uncharacterized protein n=1 Tax=Rhodonia placenta TaxID=104341 RepID=A0A8H7P583_9APHY|nr:hypothetical protein IEO21_03885 [Postia placenta]
MDAFAHPYAYTYPLPRACGRVHKPKPRLHHSPLAGLLTRWNHRHADKQFAAEYGTPPSSSSETPPKSVQTPGECAGSLVRKHAKMLTSKLQHFRGLLRCAQMDLREARQVSALAEDLEQTLAMVRTISPFDTETDAPVPLHECLEEAVPWAVYTTDTRFASPPPPHYTQESDSEQELPSSETLSSTSSTSPRSSAVSSSSASSARSSPESQQQKNNVYTYPYAESQSVPPTTSYTQARATHSPLVLAPSPPQSQAPALRPPHDRPTEVYWKDLLNPTPAPMRMEIPPLAPDEYFIEPEGSNLLACLRPSATLEPPATSSSRWVYYPDGKPDGSIQENIGTVRKHRASPRARGSAGANRRTRHKTRDANSSDSDAAYRGDTEEGREGQHGPVRGLSKDRCTSRAHNRSRQPRERAYSPYPSTSPRKTSR